MKAPGHHKENPCFRIQVMTVPCEGDKLAEILSKDVYTYIVHPGKPDDGTVFDDTCVPPKDVFTDLGSQNNLKI